MPVAGSTNAASWLNEPSNGRWMPCPAWSGLHSYTLPAAPFSSHDSHPPFAVSPPAQFRFVPDSTEYALTMFPAASNITARAPPPPLATSEFDT